MVSHNEKNPILSSQVENARDAIDFFSSLSVPDSGHRSETRSGHQEETSDSGPITTASFWSTCNACMLFFVIHAHLHYKECLDG